MKCSICGKKKKLFEKWKYGLSWDGFNCGGHEDFCSQKCQDKWLKEKGVKGM